MLKDLLRVGDEIIVSVPKIYKGYIKLNYSNKMRGEVIGFLQKSRVLIDKNGTDYVIFGDREWVKIRLLKDGSIHWILLGFVKIANKDLYKRRLEELYG